MDNSVCETCIFYHYIPEKITADPYFSSPSEIYCDEGMESFMTEEGCFRYEKRNDDYEW